MVCLVKLDLLKTLGVRSSVCCSYTVVAAFFLGIVSARSVMVSTIEVSSSVMRKDVPVTVILPDACGTKGKNGAYFPVLYLLHGYAGNHESWAAATSIKELAKTVRCHRGLSGRGVLQLVFRQPGGS